MKGLKLVYRYSWVSASRVIDRDLSSLQKTLVSKWTTSPEYKRREQQMDTFQMSKWFGSVSPDRKLQVVSTGPVLLGKGPLLPCTACPFLLLEIRAGERAKMGHGSRQILQKAGASGCAFWTPLSSARTHQATRTLRCTALSVGF